MPISLDRYVERVLAARTKRAVFDAWRADVLAAMPISAARTKRAVFGAWRADARRRGLVVGRWMWWMQMHGYLLQALLRFWAGEVS